VSICAFAKHRINLFTHCKDEVQRLLDAKSGGVVTAPTSL
jgi:hypothetical protein